MRFVFFLVLALGASLPNHASAADILFVSNSGAGTGIVTVLMGEGHTVTSAASGSTALAGDLSAYDAVYWSATSSYSVPDATFTNLTTYVTAGGRLFITGYDAIISNRLLAALAGGTSASDLTSRSDPGPIAMIENSLTTGVVDIRGVTPTGGYSDRDGLNGLTTGTVAVAGSSGGTQWALRTLGDGEIAYVSNGTYSGSHASWAVTTAGGAGAYNAALRNFAAGADSGSSDPGAPTIEFSDLRGADEGSAFMLTVTITDPEGDMANWSWDTDDDGEFGELADMASYAVLAGTTDGDMRMRVGVQAVDASGNTSSLYRSINIANVPPMITSTAPRGTSVGAAYTYQLEVDEPGGAMDPLTFEVVTGPETLVVSETGLVSWMPSDLDVSLPGEAHPVMVRVSDDDEGTDEEAWEISVSPNRPPTAPRPLYPLSMLPLDELPMLSVENATDANFDPLTYFFEVDRSETFDSPDLQASGTVESGIGYTQWTPADLERGHIYYWRAWANDGVAESERLGSSFVFVEEAAPAMPDAGLPDAGTAPDGGTMQDGGGDILPPSEDSGCAVSGASTGHSHGPAGLFLLLAGLIWARRRR